MKQRVNCGLAWFLIAIAFSYSAFAADSDQPQFKEYWQKGKAELNQFDLTQARYGELHPGKTMLIFVAEPFLREKQVKLDRPYDKSAIAVLKLNRIDRFTTGIYDYSLMSSVFSPAAQGSLPSLKVTTTVQDWCGHLFSQMNLSSDKYRVQLRSYFESEADQNYEIKQAFLEDEILNRIRLSHKQLPLGAIKIVLGSFYSRFQHMQQQVVDATATLTKADLKAMPGRNLLQYNVSFSTLQRELKIVFESEFPHRIAGWEDTYVSGWGAAKKKLTSRAVRRRLILSDYWAHNKAKDIGLRKQLGL